MSTPQNAAKGDELPPLRLHLTRADLVRYAGASGDFNPIHWSDRVAAVAGLPGVIAHGMLTMAVAARVITNWVGDPGALVEYGVRFSRPVVVPDPGTADLVVTGTVTDKRDDDRTAVVTLTARAGEEKVLGLARATVRLG